MSLLTFLDERPQIDKDEFFAEFADLPEITVKAFWLMLQNGINSFKLNGECGELRVEETPAYTLSIFAEDFQISKEVNSQEFYLYAERISRNNGRYHIRFKCLNLDSDDFENVDFYFSNPAEKVELFNCSFITGRPWNDLSFIANEVVSKAELSLSLCNQKETELLPLFKELQFFCELAEGIAVFPCLKEIVSAHNYPELVKALSAVEGIDAATFKGGVSVSMKLDVFSKAKYEDLWREIYAQIAESQEDYPQKAEGAEGLRDLRKAIEARFLTEGYSGKYPDFYKKGSMKGLHPVDSYDEPYFVGMKKSVGYFIRCVETIVDDELQIYFLSGTDLTKGNKCKDIYACMFNDNGKRLCQITEFFANRGDSLPVCLSVALKRAECKPLSEQERGQSHAEGKSPLKTFLFNLIVVGGFFAVFFNLLFFPLMYTFLLLLGEKMSFGEFLSLIPWGYLIAFEWLGFGGILGLLRAWSQRR